MAEQQPASMFRTLPRTRLGWWGFGMLGAGAALQLVQSALVWASGAWGLDAAVRVPDLVFVIVMASGVVLSALAVLVRRDYSIMMIALAIVTLISLGGVAVRTFSG
ncbi:hypothetical protein [Microcella sp.]|uniref:hypothetical protein n=1 Tax=Microcella sp. TaxID=1913979 RepID=UPI00299F7454|nr:hypothetical protein [Microcella sp.]MDX2026157.1 hypothetical protein [Microcella sp.]